MLAFVFGSQQPATVVSGLETLVKSWVQLMLFGMIWTWAFTCFPVTYDNLCLRLTCLKIDGPENPSVFLLRVYTSRRVFWRANFETFIDQNDDSFNYHDPPQALTPLDP